MEQWQIIFKRKEAKKWILNEHVYYDLKTAHAIVDYSIKKDINGIWDVKLVNTQIDISTSYPYGDEMSYYDVYCHNCNTLFDEITSLESAEAMKKEHKGECYE